MRGGNGRPVAGETITTAEAPAAPDSDQILILGDSLARGAGDDTGKGIGGNLESMVPGAEIVNIGVDGAMTHDLQARVERPAIQRLAAESGVIVLSIGGNDLRREAGGAAGTRAVPDSDAAVGTIVDRVDAIVDELRNASPHARIFVVGLYDPFRDDHTGSWRAVAEWNARLALAFAEDPRVTVVQTADLFVDHDRLSRDQFHPGAEGYALIARRIADALAPAGENGKGGPEDPPASS